MLNRKVILSTLSFLLLAVFLSSGCAGLAGKIKGSISGTVYMDGRPTSGTILIKDAGGTVIQQARTNLNGHYQLKDLSSGTYTLQYLNMQGMPFGHETTVEIRMGRFEVVDIQLTASDRMPINTGN
jgi:hypothetical protein